jgi:GTP-binding protein
VYFYAAHTRAVRGVREPGAASIRKIHAVTRSHTAVNLEIPMQSDFRRARPAAFFMQSAARFGDFPAPAHDEFCLLGRSNVGKSSFVNHVLENRSLARVSKTPGKTSLANLYTVNDRWIWVDLPGYGYAKTSRGEKLRWSRLIADYCGKRKVLRGAIWLLDIRHPRAGADIEAAEWLARLALPVMPVLTKGDKLRRGERRSRQREFMTRYGFERDPVVYSIHEHAARERFWASYDDFSAVAVARS